jgi:dynein heavy chain
MQVNIDKLIFTDIIEKQQYKMVIDQNILNKRINEALERYNIATKFGQMNLVFFTDAINHFCRISRILCQPRGNALLVGMGGSGRQSLTKLVGYILSYQMNNLQMTKGYNTDLFWKDLARILNRSGTSDQKQIFLFSDTQILYESFLEDINNILNNGEVPNLFKEDEILQIFNTLKDSAKSNGYLENKDSVYQYFVSRVRESLRIVLAFSPVGDGFRNRCRQFPSIINCCTIDWFNPWPNDALVSVAERYLRGNQYLVENEELIGKLCKIFVKIQSKVINN